MKWTNQMFATVSFVVLSTSSLFAKSECPSIDFKTQSPAEQVNLIESYLDRIDIDKKLMSGPYLKFLYSANELPEPSDIGNCSKDSQQTLKGLYAHQESNFMENLKTYREIFKTRQDKNSVQYMQAISLFLGSNTSKKMAFQPSGKYGFCKDEELKGRKGAVLLAASAKEQLPSIRQQAAKNLLYHLRQNIRSMSLASEPSAQNLQHLWEMENALDFLRREYVDMDLQLSEWDKANIEFGNLRKSTQTKNPICKIESPLVRGQGRILVPATLQEYARILERNQAAANK